MATEDYNVPYRQSYAHEDKKKKKATVATPCPQYEEMLERWDLCLDLMGGTHEMIEKREKWLPMEPRESLGAYNNRLRRTVLYNAYKRTVQVLSGLPFTRAVVVDNVPDALSYIEEDCDSDGTDLTDFANTLLEDCVGPFGKSHFYVDMPRIEERVTLADKETYKIRPYFTHVCPKNLISWDSEKIGGRDILTRIRIREEVIEDDGEWGYEEVEQIRVIYPDRHEIWREGKKDEWAMVETYPNELGYIALITVYGNRTGFMTSEPPLEDLAWLNLRHYQKLSDLDNIEHVANVPVLFGAGFAEGELNGAEIGPNRAITASDPSATLQYVEHSGAAIAASQKSIKDLEERMASLGSDLIIRKSVDRQTLGARKIDQSESISLLQIMINNVETALQQGYQIAGEWLALEAGDVVVTIADNLDTPDGPNTLDIIVQYLLDNQGMDLDQAVKELKRRGVLSDRFKLKEGVMPPKQSQASNEASNQEEDSQSQEGDASETME